MMSEQSPVTHAALEAAYEIIRELGGGGTALVYLARDRATGDEVAIKVIRSRYIEDDEAQARFAREARVVAQLQHPNIVQVREVLDLGPSGLAIVMAHVVGRTLKQQLKQDGPLSPEDTEQILRDIGSALDAAHANGLVHRDVKPENIFVDIDGRALLADFGLARSMTPDTALTMVGMALGTPAYMAPEQIDGNDLDARADVYSLGLVAWEMLIGRRAWTGEGLYAILYHQKHELPPDVRELRDDVPDRLAEVISRAIEKRRDSRWNSMRDMLDALDQSTPLTPAPRISSSAEETVQFARPSLPDETMQFVRPSLPAAVPAPIIELEAALEAVEVPAGPRPLDILRRRLPAVAPTATVAATLLIAAIAAALVRNRSSGAKPALTPVAPPAVQSLLQGDVAKPPVKVPSTIELHDTKKGVKPDSGRLPAPPAAGQRPITSFDSMPTRPLSLPPGLSKVHVAPVTADKASPTGPSDNSVWGGPPPLKLKAGIIAGGTHSCLVGTDGKVSCWGNNDHGQLGAAGERATAPTPLSVDVPFLAITAGASHTCAIARDGAAWCWGNDDRGQSGDRSFRTRLSPTRVADSHVFGAISAGDVHTCALDTYGVPWCWGSNARGQLGETTSPQTAVPIMAGSGAIRFVSIAAGSNFTCGLSASGQVSCWGENGSGQLGDGSNFDRPLPVAVASGTFTAIAAGSNHVCGVTSDGEAYCWGRDTYGQLGDGGNSDRNTPVRVKGNARFTSITAGANHTCAVAVDGTAYCWGQNTFGQLGTGGVADIAQPATVADGRVFASVRAYGSHTCGITSRGDAFCWGNNSENELGDGTQTARSRPVPVLSARK